MMQCRDKTWYILALLSFIIVLCSGEASNQGQQDHDLDKREALNVETRANPKFGHRFVGKRFSEEDDVDDDDDLGIDLRSPRFGHRFVGKRLADDLEELEKRGPKFGHRFVGKRFNPKFGHRFVGKRLSEDGGEFEGDEVLLDDEEDVEKRGNPRFGHRFVGKRFPTYITRRFNPRFGHRFVGKRLSQALQLRLSPRFGHRFVGKRLNPRFGHRFVGKRSDISDESAELVDDDLSQMTDSGDTGSSEMLSPEFLGLLDNQLENQLL